jgi:hypothetical protein
VKIGVFTPMPSAGNESGNGAVDWFSPIQGSGPILFSGKNLAGHGAKVCEVCERVIVAHFAHLARNSI